MLFGRVTQSLGWSLLHLAGCTTAGSELVVRARNAPGTTDADTFRAIRRAISDIRLIGRDNVFTASEKISKSWDGAVLYSYTKSTSEQAAHGSVEVSGGVDITCKTCYVKSSVTTQFTVSGNFSASAVVLSVEDKVKNITTSVMEDFGSYLLKAADLEPPSTPPPPAIDFNFDNLKGLPGCDLRFQFDDTEIYVAIDTRLSAGAAYSLNLYSSNSPVGLSESDNLRVGVVFTLDLILTVEAEIDLSSGFHIKLNDGLVIDITMFEKKVSNIQFPGGQFEFLPVEITGSGSLTALLRVGAHTGISLALPAIAQIGSASAGIEAAVYANVAQFVTNVTGSASVRRNSDGDKDTPGCALRVVEEYTLGLGAAAGATVAVGTHTWGPHPEATTALFYTTLADLCAVQKPTAAAVRVRADHGLDAGLAARDGLVTIAVSTTTTFTGVACMVSTLIDCPASMQIVTIHKDTLTTAITLPSGSSATYPATTYSSLLSTVPFGTNAKSVGPSSGSPAAYVPGATSGFESVSLPSENHQKLVIGLTAGLIVPAVIAGIAAFWYFVQRRKRHAAASRPAWVDTPRQYDGGAFVDAKEPYRLQVAETS